MNISIIIVNYNAQDWLEDCLRSILKYSADIKLEIIVIDNNSTDESKKFIREKFSTIKLIESDKNSGFGQANNQAAEIATGDILFFLNPDTLIQENIFQKIINAFEQDSKIGIVAPQLVLPDNSLQPWAYGKEEGIMGIIKNKFKNNLSAHQLANLSAEFDWVSGAALAIRRDIFEKINGFDEKFFMYFEDKDLCLRVKKLDYKIAVLPDAKIIHFGGKSSGGDKQRKKLYYQSQNYFWRKHYGFFKSVLMRLIRWPYKILILFTKSME
ncbi:MAG: glycosyltransferase family 2 protein [Patescibacteria group bacterium]|nr:glycosyltransferase family 2 protein [Patescibacteria group bacterium]